MDQNRNTTLESIFSEAVTLHQNGNIEAACRLYSEILAVHDSPLVNYNLGLAFYELERYEDSCRCYTQALEHAPEEIDILYNLALSLKQLGLYEETINTYKMILDLNAEEIDSLYNLACCYKDIFEDDKAVDAYLHVLDLDENHQSALNNVAFLYHKNDDFDNAEKYYSRLLQTNPEHQGARYMLVSLQGGKCKSPPPEYLRDVFDGYSGHYDTSLVHELKYDVPGKIRRLFDTVHESNDRSLAGLDLGCGTGLGGQAFTDICRTFTGVDISAGMIGAAASKNIYSSLHVAEIHEFLRECPDRFSLILATDVFNYLGELQHIFDALTKAALPGAYFCFSTENSEMSYDLQKNGRFAHSPAYIRRVSNLSGWKISAEMPAHLRKDKGRWVNGMLYLLKK